MRGSSWAERGHTTMLLGYLWPCREPEVQRASQTTCWYNRQPSTPQTRMKSQNCESREINLGNVWALHSKAHTCCRKSLLSKARTLYSDRVGRPAHPWIAKVPDTSAYAFPLFCPGGSTRATAFCWHCNVTLIVIDCLPAAACAVPRERPRAPLWQAGLASCCLAMRGSCGHTFYQRIRDMIFDDTQCMLGNVLGVRNETTWDMWINFSHLGMWVTAMTFHSTWQSLTTRLKRWSGPLHRGSTCLRSGEWEVLICPILESPVLEDELRAAATGGLAPPNVNWHCARVGVNLLSAAVAHLELVVAAASPDISPMTGQAAAIVFKPASWTWSCPCSTAWGRCFW